MNKIISKSGMNRLYFFSFILCCCVFVRENAYSGRLWTRNDMEITYDDRDRSFTFRYLIYDFKNVELNEESFAAMNALLYSEDGKKYNTLISLRKSFKNVNDVQWSEIFMKTPKGELEFPGTQVRPHAPMMIGTQITETQRKIGSNWIKSKTAYMTIKWYLSSSIRSIHSFTFKATWVVFEQYQRTYKMNEIYYMNQDDAN